MATMDSLIGLVNRIQRACTALGDYRGGDQAFSSLIDALPSAAVVGGQSSAKSSVLESILGRESLPRGSGIVTRRPLVLQLHKIDDGQQDYAEFGHMPGRRFTDFELVRKEIADETDRITAKLAQISPVPIHLSIYSPNVVNLTLIDLPGLTKVAVEGQPESIVLDTENMVRTYVEKPNSIILAANQISDAIKHANEVDPSGSCPLEPLSVSSQKVQYCKYEADEETKEILGTSSFQSELFPDPEPKSSTSNSVAYIKSLINKKMMVKVMDGKYYIGSFYCMDKQGNIILDDAVEYISNPIDPSSEKSQFVGTLLIPITKQESCHMECPN